MRPSIALLGVAATSCAFVAPFDRGPCSTGDPMANGGCDWTCNEPDAVAVEVAFLPIGAPHGLATDTARIAVALSLDAGWFVWLVDVRDGKFRTGHGACEGDDGRQCALVGNPAPASGTAALDRKTGALRIPAEDTMRLDLPVRLSDDPEPIVLPLREAVLQGRVEHAGNCIGTYTTDGWEPGATLSAKLTIAESRDVWLDVFQSSLCDQLAGTDCGVGDPATWPEPPDTTVDGADAWSLRSDVAAVGVRIDR